MARDPARTDDWVQTLSGNKILCNSLVNEVIHRSNLAETPTDSHKPVGMGRGSRGRQRQQELHSSAESALQKGQRGPAEEELG